MSDVQICGTFDPLGFQLGAFDRAWAAAMSAARVEPLDDLTDRFGDRARESAGGKMPPGR
jgi:hypothetical protein